MDITAYEEIVIPAYKKHYPKLQGTRITEIVQDVFGGDLVVVRSDDKVEHEEIAFVYPDHRVRIFYSTEELARFLDSAAHRSLFDKLFSRPVISGIAFLGLLVIISLAGIWGSYNTEVLTILGNVVAVAAGFFFGASRSPQS